jgi:5-methylcytosine-specific restriction enzyme A
VSGSSLPVQCAAPRCPRKAVGGGRCPEHHVSRWAPSQDYGRDWRKLRDAYIARHPWCEWPGCGSASAEVDHIVQVKLDPTRRLDPTNLRALCLRHHRSRTGRDGARAKKTS